FPAPDISNAHGLALYTMHRFPFLYFSCSNQDFLLKYRSTCPVQIHLSNRRWQSSQNTNILCCKTYTSGSFSIFDTTIGISTLLLVRATSSHQLGMVLVAPHFIVFVR